MQFFSILKCKIKFLQQFLAIQQYLLLHHLCILLSVLFVASLPLYDMLLGLTMQVGRQVPSDLMLILCPCEYLAQCESLTVGSSPFAMVRVAAFAMKVLLSVGVLPQSPLSYLCIKEHLQESLW